ncbi:MAG: anti-sigma factor [Pseudomonadota bacterium]|nr:anti-sigma factor [Pseudomonadota bacterium]
MTSSDDIDMVAAEFVLGTLDPRERAELNARRENEPALDAAIRAWERRLTPLTAHAGEAVPRADLFDDIRRRIAGKAAPRLVAANENFDPRALQKRIVRWRAAAITGFASAAVLAALMVFGQTTRPSDERRFVAVFQKDDRQPAFLLSIDLETRELVIRPVAADPQPGKTYQLWIKADAIGPAPKSLGLLEAISSPTRKHLPDIDPQVLKAALFGISVEPEGGSPTGQPTGPAIHGKLLPTRL